jgi:hypothetical protein
MLQALHRASNELSAAIFQIQKISNRKIREVWMLSPTKLREVWIRSPKKLREV